MIKYMRKCPNCGFVEPKKKKHTDPISHADLIRLIRYEPETGVFYRRIDTKIAVAGRRADQHKGNGYRTVSVGGKTYQAQRLAWFYSYGVWPIGDTDHINKDPSDNRIANLRDISHSHNIVNQTNRGEFRGTSFHKKGKKWTAQIGVNKRTIYLGMFERREDAREAYIKAAKKYFGESNV